MNIKAAIITFLIVVAFGIEGYLIIYEKYIILIQLLIVYGIILLTAAIFVVRQIYIFIEDFIEA